MELLKYFCCFNVLIVSFTQFWINFISNGFFLINLSSLMCNPSTGGCRFKESRSFLAEFRIRWTVLDGVDRYVWAMVKVWIPIEELVWICPDSIPMRNQK